MKWHRKTVVLGVFCASQAAATANLAPEDFVGLWMSDHPATVGERNELEIHADGRARFLRDFGEAKDQEFVSDVSGARFVDDLMILEFEGSAGEVFYKLVLSGWQSGSVRAIFGTMYMYRDGKLYNGLPISFRRRVAAANISLERTVTEHARFLNRRRAAAQLRR